MQSFRPPEKIAVSEWARRHRIMPEGTTALPGRFRAEAYQVEIMDVGLDPDVHEIVFMKCTQLGYSDAVLNNLVGYYMTVDPKPMMFVQPTIDNAKDYGKKRITPMLAACPILRGKVSEATGSQRAKGNTLALKEFSGGFLKLTGANAGTGLRADPVPVIFFDEIDGYPLDVAGEGDPISIGERRKDSFADWKVYKGSTPAKVKGDSPIEKAFDKSDQRFFHVPCPFCQFMQALHWRDPETKEYRLQYAVDTDGQIIRESVGYICASCKRIIPERHKYRMLAAGKWVAKFPGRAIVGFFMNALYMPWQELWHTLAQEWTEANREKNPEKLKAFINLRLAETWEEDAEGVDKNSLVKRREKYAAEVPTGVGILTASADVQGDRIEAQVKGWGKGEESWLIAYTQLYGDPGQTSGTMVEGIWQPSVWEQLDDFLRMTFKHESGQGVPISATMIDSGGLHTDEVYRFCVGRMNRRIFPLKGSSESGKEILHKFSQNNIYRVKLWSIGTDTAKDRIFARMKIPAPGPGYLHLPEWCDLEYLEQLTAEKAVRKYKKGRGAIREYQKTRNRNEALDLEVYALAALYIFGAQTVNRLADLAAKLADPNPPEVPQNTGGRRMRDPGIGTP